MAKLKTLASCKPSEFLVQTNRIRKSAEKWIKETGIVEIRSMQPELEEVPDGATLDERVAIIERNKKKMEQQGLSNLSNMLDSILEEHPQETLELMALCCFVDPENVDDYPVSDYLTAFTSLITDKAVIGFFTSLLSLVQTRISKESKA